MEDAHEEDIMADTRTEVLSRCIFIPTLVSQHAKTVINSGGT